MNNISVWLQILELLTQTFRLWPSVDVCVTQNLLLVIDILGPTLCLLAGGVYHTFACGPIDADSRAQGADLVTFQPGKEIRCSILLI